MRGVYTILLGLYSLGLTGYLCLLRLRHGRYKGAIGQRLFRLPKISPASTGRIWFHAASFGEVRGLEPLITLWRERHPDWQIYLSTITDSGQAHAKTLPDVDHVFYFPLDFPFIQEALCKRLMPDILCIAESDWWYWQVHKAKKMGAKVYLVNGKISERSFKRYSKISGWAKNLLSAFDALAVQTGHHAQMIKELTGISPVVTGNLKWQQKVVTLDTMQRDALRKQLGLKCSCCLILASTHAPEEDLLLPIIAKLQKEQPFDCILVPRHIERGPQLRQLAKKYGASVIVVDVMGMLRQLYLLADIAFVGGTFAEDVGGHNLLEAIFAGCALIYGPYIYSQREMHEAIMASKGAIQVTVNSFQAALTTLLTDVAKRQALKESAKNLLNLLANPLEDTYQLLSKR